MPVFDSHANFAYSTVAQAPAPATTGTSLIVQAGDGVVFPATPFNAVLAAAGANPTRTNAEVVRVTARAGDTLTITRAQEGSTARAVVPGDQIYAAITVKTLTDLEVAVNATSAGVTPLSGTVKDVGQAGQLRAGRQLALADFTTLLGRAAPIGLYTLADLTDLSGNGRALTNKAGVTFGSTGMVGQANVATFNGGNTSALYRVDGGAADPFRIKTGSLGCWFKTAKRGTVQALVTKWSAAPNLAYNLNIGSNNALVVNLSSDGTAVNNYFGMLDVCDDRWHFAVVTHDGSTVRLYLDGALEMHGAFAAILPGTTAPLNIGGQATDGATAPTNPLFGRVSDAFVHGDVLDLDDIRMLYAAKIAHGLGLVPANLRASLRRRKRGAALVAGDFTAAPLHLYSLTALALTDAGTLNNALTNNGTTVGASSVDGSPGNAANFAGAQSLSVTDTGLPSGTGTRSYGGWFKTASTNVCVIGWGTTGTADARIIVNGNGQLASLSGADTVTGPVVNDGQWHHAAVVEDNTAYDGNKRKLYLDGKLVGSSTVLTALTLAGVDRFRIGGNPDGTNLLTGQVDEIFVTGSGLSVAEINVLYQKSALGLGTSPLDSGTVIEGVDATNVYVIGDQLGSQNILDLGVGA